MLSLIVALALSGGACTGAAACRYGSCSLVRKDTLKDNRDAGR